MYEGQLMQLQQQTFNMEQAAMTTENLKNTVRVVPHYGFQSAWSAARYALARRFVYFFWKAKLTSADGDGRRDAGGQQGDEEAVQGDRH